MKSKNQNKLDQIIANAKQNRRDARKIDLTALSPESEERLKTESITESQMALMDKLGISYDSRPLFEGGSCSRWNAMYLIDEALREARERREAARAKPITDKQQLALLSFGCNADEIAELTAGDASDLIRNFTQEIKRRSDLRVSKRA